MLSTIKQLGTQIKNNFIPPIFTVSSSTSVSSTTINGASYKVHTFTNTTPSAYTINCVIYGSPGIIYYMCVGAGGSGFVCGGGAGQFKEGSINVNSSQTITLSVAPTTSAGATGASSTIVFSVETANNVTSVGGTAGGNLSGGTSGNGFTPGTTNTYGGGGGGSAGNGENGSVSFGGDGGLPKKPTVAGISAVYPNTYWAAGGPGGYLSGNSYAGAGSGTSGYGAGKGISLPGYTATTSGDPNAGANTGSGGGSSNPQNTGGSGIIVIAVPG